MDAENEKWQPARGPTWRELGIQAAILLGLLGCLFPGAVFRGEAILPGDILFQYPPWSAYAPAGYEGPRNNLPFDSLTPFQAHNELCTCLLRGGEWPLWNPCQDAGMPLLANYQSTVFYPLWLVMPLFGPSFGVTIFTLLKLWCCGLTAYLYGRGIGLRAGPSRFLSIAWMLSGYNLLFCYWPLPGVSAWVPLLLLGVEYLLKGRLRRGFFTMVVAEVLLLLGGHPESAFFMGIGIGLYLALRLALDAPARKRILPKLGVAGASWAIALMICAVQLLPFLEYVPLSDNLELRSESATAVRSVWSLTSLACLWVPRFFGTQAEATFWGPTHSIFGMMKYSGAAIWVFLPLFFTRGPIRRAMRGRAAALGLVSLLTMYLAWGAPGALFLLNLPFIRSMFAFYIDAFAAFALPVLAAIALEHWLSARRRPREAAWGLISVIVAGGLLWTFFRFHRPVLQLKDLDAYVFHQLLIAGLAAAAAFIPLLLWAFLPRRRLAVWLASIILAADLAYAFHGLLVSCPRTQLFPRTSLTDYLQDLEPPNRPLESAGGEHQKLRRSFPSPVSRQTGDLPAERKSSTSPAPSSEPLFATRRPGRLPIGSAPIPVASFPACSPPYGIQEWLAYDGIAPARVPRFRRAMGPDIWNAAEPLCALGYYLHNPARGEPAFPADQPGRFDLVASLDGLEVYQNNAALPRAFLVGGVRVIHDPDALFDHMRAESFDPLREVLLEAPPPEALPAAPPCDPEAPRNRADPRIPRHPGPHPGRYDRGLHARPRRCLLSWLAGPDRWSTRPDLSRLPCLPLHPAPGRSA